MKQKFFAAFLLFVLLAVSSAPSEAKVWSHTDVQGQFRYVAIAADIFVDGDSEVFSGVGTCTFNASQVTFSDSFQRMNSSTIDTDDLAVTDHDAEDFYITDEGELHVILAPTGEAATAEEEMVGAFSDTGLGELFFLGGDGSMDMALGFKNFATVPGWDSSSLLGDWRGIDMTVTGNPNPAFSFGFDSTTFYAGADTKFRYSFWEPGLPAIIDTYGGYYSIVNATGRVDMTAQNPAGVATFGGNLGRVQGWIGNDSQVFIYADVGESTQASFGVLLKTPQINKNYDTTTLFGAYSAGFFAQDYDPSATETVGASVITVYGGTLLFDGVGGGQILLPGDTESGEAEVFIDNFTYVIDNNSGTVQITIDRGGTEGNIGVRAAFNDSRTIIVGAMVDTGASDVERFAFIAVLDPSTSEEEVDAANGEEVKIQSADFDALVDFDPGCFSGPGVKIRSSIMSDSSSLMTDTNDIDASIAAQQSRMFKGLDLTPNTGAAAINNNAITVDINFSLTDLQKLGIDPNVYADFDPMIMELDANGREVWKRIPPDSIVLAGDLSSGQLKVSFKPPHFSRYSISGRRIDTSTSTRTETGLNGFFAARSPLPLDTAAIYKYIYASNKRLNKDSGPTMGTVSVGAAGCTIAVGVNARSDSIVLYVNTNAKYANAGLRAPDASRIGTGTTETAAAQSIGYPATDTGLKAYEEAMYEVTFRDTLDNTLASLDDTTGTRYKYILELQMSDTRLNTLVQLGGDTSALVLYSSKSINATSAGDSLVSLGTLTYVSSASSKNKRVFRSGELTTASVKVIGITGSTTGDKVKTPGCVLSRMGGRHPSILNIFRATRDLILETSWGRRLVEWYYSF